MEKIVVVGANHAGTAALNTILDNYVDKEVIAFDGNSNISFLGCGMALWIGKQIAGSEGLFYSNKETLEAKGAKIHLESKVVEVDYDNKIVYAIDKDGNKIEQAYDKLIMATGAKPIDPKLEGEDLENVQFVKLFQNAQDVIDKMEKPEIKHVTVVGAGYIGVELAEAFKRLNKGVRLIDISDTVLPAYYDSEFTDLMKNNLTDNGIELTLNESVVRITGDKVVQGIETSNGHYDTDMVVLAIGFRPNSELAKDKVELFRNGAYLVNKKQETSIKDVYAVGDCATVYDNSIQDTSYIALASNAVRSGIVAAHNVCGNTVESNGVQGSNGISIFGLNMVSTGLTLEKALHLGYDAVATDYNDLQKPAFMEKNNNEVQVRIVYDENTRIILGAQMASHYDISMGIHMFSLAIQEQTTIEKLALLDLFFLPHFNQPYNYITMAALKSK